MLASARHAIYIACIHAGTHANYSRTVYYHKCSTTPILYELQNALGFADRQAGKAAERHRSARYSGKVLTHAESIISSKALALLPYQCTLVMPCNLAFNYSP